MRDRLCIGDMVQVRFAPLEGRRGIIDSINIEEELVLIRQELGAAIVST